MLKKAIVLVYAKIIVDSSSKSISRIDHGLFGFFLYKYLNTKIWREKNFQCQYRIAEMYFRGMYFSTVFDTGIHL